MKPTEASVVDVSAPTRLATVGYLFSDIERSTERWERTPDRMRPAIERHNEIIDALVARHGGVVRDHAGDGVFAIFESGTPLQCALDIQLAIQAEDWGAVGGLKIRIGLHVGRTIEGVAVDQTAANRAARIMDSGWGGQILVSREAQNVFQAPSGARFVNLGICRFKGIDDPIEVSGLIDPRLQQTEFPPLRNDAAALGIPHLATSIVGRTREIGEIIAALGQARVLTIVGAGGAGKTRLAAEIAAIFYETKPTTFVALNAVMAPGELAVSLAGAVRLPLHGPAAPEQQLLDYFRDRNLLLVLDNADAIAGNADFLNEIVVACPRVTLLATSREPLRVHEEVLYRLDGLSAEAAAPDDLNSPAYELFALEASLQDVDATDIPADPATFREICRLLNGWPLALRLVAKWSRLLTLEEILEQLRRDVRFLSDDADGVLHSVFEGSWRLLDARQQNALSRVSVFAGAFDWRAAEYVAEVDLSTYGALADKSLLEKAEGRRVCLHPVIRAYARDRLKSCPADEEAALQRHCEFYLGGLSAARPSSDLHETARALEQRDIDFADIREAWRYGIDVRSPLAPKAAVALHHYIMARSRLREGVALFDIDAGMRATNALLQSMKATCLFQRGDLAGAEAAARGVFGMRGDPQALAFARLTLGGVAHTRGEYCAAQRHYLGSIRLWSRTDNLMSTSYAATNLALLHFAHAAWADAAHWVERGFRLSREAGNPVGMLVAQMVAGDLAVRQGRLDAAARNFEKALAIETSSPVPHLRASVLRRFGSLLRSRQDGEGALRYHREALDLASEAGDQRSQAHALVEIGEDFDALAQAEGARTNLLAGVRLAHSLGVEPLVARGLNLLARLDLASGGRRHAERIAASLAGREEPAARDAYQELTASLGALSTSPMSTSVEDILNAIADEAEIGVLR